MPYGDSGYSYKVVSSGELPGFPTKYDSSGFASGTAPFSNGPGGCGNPQATDWPSSTDLLAVHAVDVPAGATGVSVSVGIDNDIVVYWDGTKIGSNSHDGCASNDSFTYQVPQSLSQPGHHEVAFRAIDRGALTYFDATVRATGGGGGGPRCTTAGQWASGYPRSASYQGTSAAKATWQFQYGISTCEGLVMSNVSLGGRLMAERMSLPYLDLGTCNAGARLPASVSDCTAHSFRHIVLTPDETEAQSDPSLYTHVQLKTQSVMPQPVGPPRSGPCISSAYRSYPCNHDVIQATYRVDLAPPTGNDTTDTYLLVTQKYEFYEDFGEHQVPQLACEPAAPIPPGLLGLEDCGRWKPMVQYQYHRGRNSPEVLERLNAAARLHFTPDAVAPRGEAFFRDCDPSFPTTNCGPPGAPEGLKFEKEELQNETVSRAFSVSDSPPFNTIPGRYDNLHITASDNVGAPAPPPGCAPCVHLHWRWGGVIGDLARHFGAADIFGDGLPENADGEPSGVYNPRAHQTLDVGVVTYHSDELSPFNFITDLVKANPDDLNMSIKNGQYKGGITTGPETLNLGPAGCYASNAIASWGQCGVVAWLSATAYGEDVDSFGDGDEDSDTFFAFSGFFCARCSEPDYSDFLHLKPTYAPPHLSALKAGHPLTIKFGNLPSAHAFGDSEIAGDLKIFDLLPDGMTHPVVTTTENPADAPINCSLTRQNGRTELACDINSDRSHNLPCVRTTCITVQGNMPTTPGPYDNTSHVVWQEAYGDHIAGNLRQVDPITVSP